MTCLSLKYINDNYKNISNICKWIYHELVRYNYNDSKLTRSLDKRDYKIIKSIIKLNTDKDVFNNYLINFCVSNRIKMAKLIIDNGADIHFQLDYALRYACVYDNFNMAGLLISSGANVHAIVDESLRFASRIGHYSIVKLLIENGADIHSFNDEALKLASHNGYTNVAKLLIDNGADESVLNRK